MKKSGKKQLRGRGRRGSHVEQSQLRILQTFKDEQKLWWTLTSAQIVNFSWQVLLVYLHTHTHTGTHAERKRKLQTVGPKGCELQRIAVAGPRHF